MNQPAPYLTASQIEIIASGTDNQYRAYVVGGSCFITDSHDLVRAGATVRTATTMIGGQLLNTYVAERTIFSLADLAGEFGGAIPVDNTSPYKKLLQRTAIAMASAVASAGPVVARSMPSWTGTALIKNLAESEEESPIPLTYNDKPLASIDMLYMARGGAYNVLAGAVFIYSDRSVEDIAAEAELHADDATLAIVLPDLADHPEFGQEPMEVLQKMVAWRNRYIDDVFMEDYIQRTFSEIIEEVGTDILMTRDASDSTGEHFDGSLSEKPADEVLIQNAINTPPEADAATRSVIEQREQPDPQQRTQPQNPFPPEHNQRLGELMKKWELDPLAFQERLQGLWMASEHFAEAGKPGENGEPDQVKINEAVVQFLKDLHASEMNPPASNDEAFEGEETAAADGDADEPPAAS